jgi:hypothetical protein
LNKKQKQEITSQHGKNVIFLCSVILATVLTEKRRFHKRFQLTEKCVGEKKKRFSRVF